MAGRNKAGETGLKEVELAVIGGGPAGMAAAIEAYKNGIKDVLIIERDGQLGGILPQCIHTGFGLQIFKEELTGPEYAWRFVKEVEELGIGYKTDTMVLNISADRTITAVNSTDGLIKLKAGAVILAMGCRERTRGALNIPGTRPAGIYTAGTAQRFVNIEGYIPGKKVVILGSGDIGLIMARRMTLEGAEVKMVCEILPYPGGLRRNIVQCLEDYNIPLKLSHTVVSVHGRERLEGVTIAKVDENRRPVMDTAEYVECDTLLLSVGLIPENELSKGAGISIDPVTGGHVVDESRQTSAEGIFACGNVAHVHDLVDNVTEEAMLAGRSAARYIQGKRDGTKKAVKITAGSGVRYVVPHLIHVPADEEVRLFFRVNDVYRDVTVVVKCGDSVLIRNKKVRMVPGEMESTVLTRQLLEGIGHNGEVTVQIEDSGTENRSLSQSK